MTIKVLTPETALKIAAGEVIERPASVVKELIENSIDAGARNIRVEIKNGGLNYLRVSDDGGGIPFAEVPIAFERHATSKINEAEDLYRLHTLGFRGEALPSVAAVSQMTLLSRPRLAEPPEGGSEIAFEGGKQIYHRGAGAPFGTIITVRNLFFNLPARQKWSRSGTSEAGHILNILNNYALAYPEIKFAVVSENRLLLQTSGNGDLKDAIAKVYGADAAQAMLPVSFPTENLEAEIKVDADGVVLEDEHAASSQSRASSPIQVTGYTSDPSFSKPNRNYITFFVNKRLVQSRLLTYAVQEAYHSLIMAGRFPVAVLLIEVDPAQVDANVHPAKTEVRFLYERAVFAAVQKAVRAALVAHASMPIWSEGGEALQSFANGNGSKAQTALAHSIYMPQVDDKANPTENGLDYAAPTQTSSNQTTFDLGAASTSNGEIDLIEDAPFSRAALRAVASSQANEQSADPISFQPDNRPLQFAVSPTNATPKLPLLRVLGQMANSYIVAEGPDGMYLIDQHAAHERVMYEHFQTQLAGRTLDSQLLLEPARLELTPSQRLALQDPERLAELNTFGFQLEPYEETDTWLLRATPAALFGRAVASSLREMLEEADGTRQNECGDYSSIGGDRLDEPDQNVPRSWRDRMAASLACHSAVRAGQILSQPEMRELIVRLEQTSSPHSCAHGRPSIVHLSQGQLEKRFGRK